MNSMRHPHLILGASLLAIAAPALAQTRTPAARTPVAPVAAPEPTETLREAMAKAYNTNPDIGAERANLRATDENVPIARAAGLPGLSSNSSYSESVQDTAPSVASPGRSARAGLDLSVPIFNGGAVRNSVRAAETRVEAGRANLRGAEADLFTSVVAAYMDVIRDESIVRLNQQNARVLGVNLQATRDRFEVGDLTRTDVAQSEARLALAQGQLQSAEARLIGSRENYIRVVGSAPGVLAPPPPLPNLPTSPEQAVTVALEDNPNLDAAERLRDATKFDVDVARASRLPQLSVGVGSSYYNYLNSVGSGSALGIDNDGISTSLGVQLSLPIFQGGRPAAQIRQAQARRTVAIEQFTATERAVVSQVRSAYATYRAALRVIESSRTAVEANKLSLEGVRAENSVGTRTILDILNAEQEFLNSQVTLVTAERDAYVAGFAVLAAMGQAEARDLGLDGGPLYDPVANYNRVRRSWNDWGAAPEDPGQGTRTTDTPAQTPVVVGPLDPVLQRPVDSDTANPTGGVRNR
jgi:outer membrane protein